MVWNVPNKSLYPWSPRTMTPQLHHSSVTNDGVSQPRPQEPTDGPHFFFFLLLPSIQCSWMKQKYGLSGGVLKDWVKKYWCRILASKQAVSFIKIQGFSADTLMTAILVSWEIISGSVCGGSLTTNKGKTIPTMKKLIHMREPAIMYAAGRAAWLNISVGKIPVTPAEEAGQTDTMRPMSSLHPATTLFNPLSQQNFHIVKVNNIEKIYAINKKEVKRYCGLIWIK